MEPPPPTTDVFPVSISVHHRYTAPNITVAAVYGSFAAVIALRLLVRGWRPSAGHRAIAYCMVLAMCLLRVAMFVIFTVISQNQPYQTHYGEQPAPWELAITADMLNIVGWAAFCSAVFALGYSWSGRIPCMYCMVQFSDAYWGWKSCAIYVIPTLLTVLSVVASPLRLVASNTPWGQPADYAAFVRATFVARASAAAAVAFCGCFVVVVPYTAYVRHLARQASRKQGIDHVAVAAMVRKSTLQRDTDGDDFGAVALLLSLGLLLLCEATYRLMLLQSSLQPVDSAATWERSQVAVYVLLVLPEWLAIAAVVGIDESNLQNGRIALWIPWVSWRRWSWDSSRTSHHPLLALHSESGLALSQPHPQVQAQSSGASRQLHVHQARAGVQFQQPSSILQQPRSNIGQQHGGPVQHQVVAQHAVLHNNKRYGHQYQHPHQYQYRPQYHHQYQFQPQYHHQPQHPQHPHQPQYGQYGQHEQRYERQEESYPFHAL